MHPPPLHDAPYRPAAERRVAPHDAFAVLPGTLQPAGLAVEQPGDLEGDGGVGVDEGVEKGVGVFEGEGVGVGEVEGEVEEGRGVGGHFWGDGGF